MELQWTLKAILAIMNLTYPYGDTTFEAIELSSITPTTCAYVFEDRNKKIWNPIARYPVSCKAVNAAWDVTHRLQGPRLQTVEERAYVFLWVGCQSKESNEIYKSVHMKKIYRYSPACTIVGYYRYFNEWFR